MMRPLLIPLALLGALLLGSCRATTAAYRFTPSPLEVLVQEGEGEPVLARMLVGVPGAEREGRRGGGYPFLIVRVRIENKSEDRIVFDPATAMVVGSDLAEFGPPRARPDGALVIEPGEARTSVLRFPFPHDTRDLDAPLLTGINLQVELEIAMQRTVELSVTIERDEPDVVFNPGPAFTFGPGYYFYGR